MEETSKYESDRKIRIVVIDDDPTIVKVVRIILQTNGFEVIEALNGAEALDLVENELPDIVLLDIMMPEMDGFEVLRRLKENEATKEIPVVFLTAKTGAEYVNRGVEMGASEYIIKPFSPAALIAKINELTDSGNG